jgi:hypothetical protein
MLKNVRNIQCERRLLSFRASGNEITRTAEVVWESTALVDPSTLKNEKIDGDQFKQVESYRLNINVTKNKSKPEMIKWMVVKAFIGSASDVPKELKAFVLDEQVIATDESASQTIPDIGIAAQLGDGKETGLFYNSLPFEAACGLPVDLHSRFAMSPDRRSLRTDSKDGDWNKFLAQFYLPKLYFIFLERLLTSHRSVDYYAYWPSIAIRTQNEISSVLQAAFWDQIPRCPRKVFLSTTGIPVSISLAIFDTRVGAGGRTNVDSVKSLFIQARPNYAIVNSPVVISSLFHGDARGTANKSNLVCLTPEYIRTLLRDASIVPIVNQLADSDLKYILLFILDQRAIGNLEGCHILRVADNQIKKIAKSGSLCGLRSSKNLYIVDKDGFNLFKSLSADSIISPAVVDKDVLTRLGLDSSFNVREVDGTVIDKFLRPTLGGDDNLRTYKDGESRWLLALYNYVTSRKFKVASYEKHPMLPLSNKGRTFVSMEFWNDPRLLPPINDQNQRRIIDQFPELHILANLNLIEMKQRASATSAQRFLAYLNTLAQGDLRAVERIFRANKVLGMDSTNEVRIP